MTTELHHHIPPRGRASATQPGRTRGTPLPGLVSQHGVYAPLSTLDPSNPLMGGYGWLSKTDGGATFHPGLDLNSASGGSGTGCNADEGLPVVSPVSGIVRACCYWDGSTLGEGNHIWVELTSPACVSWAGASTWFHVDHLKAIWVGEGQQLIAGQAIGACGRTGGWDCAHAHCEWAKAKPSSWYQWPYGWSRSQVEATYYDPLEWWDRTVATAALWNGETPNVDLMEDWQVKGWVLATLYEWAGIPYNPNSGTAQAWVTFLRAGTYLGRPRTEERPYGEGSGAGVWIEFDHGVLFYRLSDGGASITG